MATKTKHGGKRKNSGRKKIADKKMQIPLFVRNSIVIQHGGAEGVRQKAYKAIGQI